MIGGGSDVLRGFGGADSFVFRSPLGAANIDLIVDFDTQDTIRLAKSAFAALSTGALAASAFKDLSLGAADSNDRILYDRCTGRLFYDADGSGAGARLQFADLVNEAALTQADFLVF